MNKHLLLAAAATLAFAPATFAQDSKMGGDKMSTEKMAGEKMKMELSAADQTFIEKAAIGGMFEVESSELALKESDNADIKTFAKQMVSDHGKVNAELKSAASDMGGKVPTKLDSKHEQVMKKLEGVKDAEFDAMYLQAQRDAHREAVSLISTYSNSKGNPELTACAAKTLPTLQMHQKHLQDMGSMAQSSSGMGRAATDKPMDGKAMKGD